MNTIIGVALAGLITSLVIEVVKELFERKRRNEERERRSQAEFHSFLASDAYDGQGLRPIARLLVSTAYELKPVENIHMPNKEIRSVREITIPTIAEPEQMADVRRHNADKSHKPVIAAPVERRFFRRLGFRPDYAQVWKTRDRVYFLDAVTTMGRNPENDIVLHDVQNSRHHAVIRYEKPGYVLYDFAITNPIEVNDEEIPYYKVLADGDVIEIGAFLVEFQQANSLKSSARESTTKESP